MRCENQHLGVIASFESAAHAGGEIRPITSCRRDVKHRLAAGRQKGIM